jgi:micrococcal nuclease
MKNRTTFYSIIYLLFLSTTAQSADYHWKVQEVVDGDTIKIYTPEGFPNELPLSVRVRGVDTPEKGKRAKCEKESLLSRKATVLTKDLVANSREIIFSDISWDKYGGRILAKVTIDGKDLSQELISANLARPYFGDKKKGWCK